MSGIAFWLRAHPGPRTLFVAALALALCATGGLLHGRTGPAGGGSPRPEPALSGDPGEPSPAAPLTSPGPGAVAAAPNLDPESAARAEAVATAFLVAFASYRFDDAATALRDRLRPYDTDRLDAELARGGGGGLDLQERAARHEVANASVGRLAAQGTAPDGRLVVVALVVQDVRSDAGGGASQRTLELFLDRTPAGWRVDEILP